MGKLERRKDLAQEAVESTAIRVGRIATIITTAVADVAREIGDAVSDGLEMRQAAKRAAAEARTAPQEPEATSDPEPAAPAAPEPADRTEITEESRDRRLESLRSQLPSRLAAPLRA